MHFAFLPVILLLGLLPPPQTESKIIALPSPAPLQSGTPRLYTGPDGTVHLIYAGPGRQEGERAIWLSKLAPGSRTWSEPRLVVSTPLLLENWADFAALTIGDDGQLWVQWFQNREADQRGYSGWMARSRDGGETWSEPVPLGHEFVSLAPLSAGRVMAVWLQNARPPRPPGTARPQRDPNAPYAPSMKLSARLMAADGSTLQEWTVDPDVCTCCQTTLAVLPDDQLLVSYRAHTPKEVRDNYVARFNGEIWEHPVRLHPDNWVIPGCPVNGPAAHAQNNTLGIVWFTAAGGIARVSAKFSTDAGHTFSEALPLDLGSPIGRVDCLTLGNNLAVASWLESSASGNTAGIYVRSFGPDELISEPWLIAKTSQARASGFPRMALRPNGEIILAYTEDGESSRIHTVLLQGPPKPSQPAAILKNPLVLTALEFCEP
jgi:hypothetical protein